MICPHDWRDEQRSAMAERCGDEHHCTCVPGLRRAAEDLKRERDEARADLDKCAQVGWFGLVQIERRRADEANSAAHALAEERTRAVVRAEKAEAEVERLREALIAAQGIVQSVQGGRRGYAPNAVYADLLFDCAHTDAVARQIAAALAPEAKEETQ